MGRELKQIPFQNQESCISKSIYMLKNKSWGNQNSDMFCFVLNYILLIVRLQLSWFPPFAPLHPAPPTPSGNHCSCPWVMDISSLATPFPILYFISPWLLCNYLFVLLNPLICSPIPTHPPPIWQPSTCSLYPRICLCSSYLFSLFFRFNCW